MSIFGYLPSSDITGYVDSQTSLRVLKAGDTMTGDLNMSEKLIRGLPTTSPPLYHGDEATSWSQTTSLVIDAANTRVKKEGDTMSGDLNMGTKNITSLAEPTNISDAATKNYVDGRVKKSGDTMTGDLNMSGKLVKGLPTISPPIYHGDEATSWSQTTSLVIDAANTRVKKSGDTMTGDLNMGVRNITSLAEPTNISDAATKNYVDGRVKKSGDTMTGDLNMGTNRITSLADPINAQDAATKNYAVKKSGDTMTGDLNMGTNRITSLADPINAQDAATKKYVDKRIYVIAKVGTNTTQNLSSSNHFLLGNLFTQSYGSTAWNGGIFTTPETGLYFVSLLMRVQPSTVNDSFGNTYTSINNSTDYAGDWNNVYKIHTTIGSTLWTAIHMAGFIYLQQGELLRLYTSYGSGNWFIHGASSFRITRFSN